MIMKAFLLAAIKNGAPQYIFDLMEIYYKLLGSGPEHNFQTAINVVLSDAHQPWLLSDGVIFRIDSRFMAEVLATASYLLSQNSFEGPTQEFQDARCHFESKDYKGAIHHANQAIESTMKAILQIDRAKPGELIRQMIESGIIPSYYDNFMKNFEQILRCVNIARNEEAGHGQGASIKEVPEPLAELIINFCGSLIIYLIKQHMSSAPEPKSTSTVTPLDDDIPF